MSKRRSLYEQNPSHRVDLEPSPGTVRVRFAGEVLADSERALLVRETGHDPVVYFPREDVRAEFLESTEHSTFCPFKGDASYWSLRVGDREEANAAWSYEDPFEEVVGLKNFMAFYADRVEWERSAKR